MASMLQNYIWKLVRTKAAPRVLHRAGVVPTDTVLPAPSFLLLADHSNALDPLVIGSLSERPIRYMANIEGVSWALRILADLVGAYGRRKSQSDRAALRKTMELAASGEAIGIFPEGDRSWDGASLPLRPGCARLAKRLGLPLVLVRQSGNYLTRPRWATYPRRGLWELDIKVFEADEVGRLSEALLEQIIASALAKDEIKEALRKGRRFSGEGVAAGIERFLWRCPVCGQAQDEAGRGTSLEGRGDEIRCNHCGTRWLLDANLRVTPLNFPRSYHESPVEDLKDWSDWQRASLFELALPENRDKGGLRASKVLLSRSRLGRFVRVGRGSLRLEDGLLLFEASGISQVFDARDIRGFVDNFNAYSEFSYRGERWRMAFGGGNIAKWCAVLNGGLGESKEGPMNAATSTGSLS